MCYLEYRKHNLNLGDLKLLLSVQQDLTVLTPVLKFILLEQQLNCAAQSHRFQLVGEKILGHNYVIIKTILTLHLFYKHRNWLIEGITTFRIQGGNGHNVRYFLT